MSQEDRASGYLVNTAIKTPCDVATTANITLSGEQTIDGTLTSGSRVLVKNQTSTIDNGIWISGVGTWTRAQDFDGSRDITQGTIIKVNNGLNSGLWEITTSGDPVPGVDAIVFSRFYADNSISVTADFGATGDGTTDDTAAIQAAIDAAGAAGGGTVFFPAGTYFLSATLLIDQPNVVLRGENRHTTFLTRSGDYGNTISFTGDDATGTPLQDVGIEGFTITNSGLMSSGYLVSFNGVQFFFYRDIELKNGFSGLELSGATQGDITNFFHFYNNLYGGSITGRILLHAKNAAATYAHPSCGGLFINTFNIRGNGGIPYIDYAIKIEGADGIWFNNGHVGGANEANIHISADTAENTNLLFFSNVMADAHPAGYGVYMAGNTSSMRGIMFDNMNIKGGASGTNGLYIAPGADVDYLQLSNCCVSEYTQDGFKILGGTNISFTGCQARGNGYTTTNTYSGYYFKDTVGVQITGGQSGWFNNARTERQKYGIDFGTGCADFVLSGVDLLGNVSGSINGGDGAYRATACLTDSPVPIVKNMVDYNGMNFNGTTTYLNASPLTGITDTKKGSFVCKVRFDNASGTQENILQNTGGTFAVNRTGAGNLTVLAENSAGTTILSQAGGNALAAAGDYVIMCSWDLATPGSMQMYVNDEAITPISTTFTNDTIDYTVAEYSVGASVPGTLPVDGDIYMMWFDETTNVDFSIAANRRQFTDIHWNLRFVGKTGEAVTGTAPILFLGYDKFTEWPFNRGRGTGAFTINGTPTAPATIAYGENNFFERQITVVVAAHTVGETVEVITANFAGTVTLTLPSAAANPQREIIVRTITANTVVSASSNVVPVAGGAAGTAILAATAGKWARLKSDGAVWQTVMAG